jgi:16S rRNA (cytosine1402-N4)-methyltransferase
MTGETVHIPVMVREVVELLEATRGGDYLDCTLGGAGHTQAILAASPEARVYALDRDNRAIARAQRTLESDLGRVTISHGRFSDAGTVYPDRRFDGVLADLGVSTDQLREGRGFAFSEDAPLDMRMNEADTVTAHDLVNASTEHDLFVLLRKGGVGSEARAVARAIVRERPVATTRALAAIVTRVVPPSRGRGGERKSHPATVVFQALRIAVNDEFGEIERLLAAVPALVKPGARTAIITFHSLEDKLVTETMRRWEGGGEFSAQWPGAYRPEPLGRLVTRKAVVPGEDEVAQNPSSRSARLRVFRFR